MMTFPDEGHESRIVIDESFRNVKFVNCFLEHENRGGSLFGPYASMWLGKLAVDVEEGRLSADDRRACDRLREVHTWLSAPKRRLAAPPVVTSSTLLSQAIQALESTPLTRPRRWFRSPHEKGADPQSFRNGILSIVVVPTSEPQSTLMSATDLPPDTRFRACTNVRARILVARIESRCMVVNAVHD